MAPGDGVDLVRSTRSSTRVVNYFDGGSPIHFARINILGCIKCVCALRCYTI